MQIKHLALLQHQVALGDGAIDQGPQGRGESGVHSVAGDQDESVDLDAGEV